MKLNLDGKRAVVTGSTAGIGYAVARRLAEEGALVCLNGRDDQRTAAAVQRLRGELPEAQVEGVAADLGDAEGCERLAAATRGADLLVNNVGIYEPGQFEDLDDRSWQRLFDLNLMSGVRLSRLALPAMKARGFGRIVFVASESALNPPAEMLHYGMTKTAQLALSRGLAELTVASGVTVNCVLPGPTATEGSTVFVARMAAAQGIDAAEVERRYFANDRPSSLIRRFIQPDEVAAAIVFLCSPLAAAINGSALRVDGGVVRSIL